jgi:hypothetical protein
MFSLVILSRPYPLGKQFAKGILARTGVIAWTKIAVRSHKLRKINEFLRSGRCNIGDGWR